MYVRTPIRRLRRGLGSNPCTDDPGLLLAGGTPCTPGIYGIPTSMPSPYPAAPNVTPSKSILDWLSEAVTGHPSQSTVDANTQNCIATINYQRMMAPGTVPAGAENTCLTDQQAYTKVIGGTSQDILNHVLPSAAGPGTIASYAILALLGLGALYVVTR